MKVLQLVENGKAINKTEFGINTQFLTTQVPIVHKHQLYLFRVEPYFSKPLKVLIHLAADRFPKEFLDYYLPSIKTSLPSLIGNCLRNSMNN